MRPARDSKITLVVLGGELAVATVVTDGQRILDGREAGFYCLRDQPRPDWVGPEPALDADEGLHWIRGEHAADSNEVQALLAARKLWESGQPQGMTGPTGPTGVTGPTGPVGPHGVPSSYSLRSRGVPFSA